MVARRVFGARSSTNYPPPILSDIREVRREVRRYEIEKADLEKSYPLLDRLHEGVFVCDFDGRFHFANLSARDTLGYGAEEMLGMAIKDILPEGQLAEVLRAMDETRIQTTNPGIRRFSVISKSGSEITLAAKASLVLDAGESFGMLAFVRDVTDFFRMQEELTEGRAFRAVGEASSKAAHDIRNLISPARLLLGRFADTDLRSLSEADMMVLQTQSRVALAAIDQVSQLTSDMLQLSVPGPKKIEPVNINRIIFDTLMKVKSSMQEQMKLVTPKTVFKADLPPVMGDRTQLERAILNVLINAVEAMPSGGTLGISTDLSEGAMVRVRVTDTGAGMEQAVLDSIFVPFYTTKEKGTGLGLSITAQTVKFHKGYINIESEAGKGTTFEILIPMADASP
ncbi:MAG TPA: ATP-binding protein [Candidatus Bilamarchaeum sp.]|nr:ATP-binding protein [Candidatus Bilamarchaeum sp.]